MTHSLSAAHPGRLGRVGTSRAARWARRNLRFVVTGVVVVAFMIALVLFARTYGTGGDTPPAGGGAGLPGATGSGSAPSPSSSRPARGSVKAAAGVPDALPRFTITPGEPGGFTYAPIPTHQLVLEATSSRPIGDVGYLVPTSPDHSYGRAEHLGTSWVVHTTVTGKPYYALLFIQAGATGTPITCTIMLDGRVASRKTTSGVYGRQVCLA